MDTFKILTNTTLPQAAVRPGESITQTWRIQNTGEEAWKPGYYLSYISGGTWDAPQRVDLPALQPGEEADITLTMTAPAAIGAHRSNWRVRNHIGHPFGPGLVAAITVQPIPDNIFNGIVDLSSYNRRVNLTQAKQSGVAAVIAKASQGLHHVDSSYKAFREQAKTNDLLWGAYHFGTSGDPLEQADHFLKTAEPDETTLLALDLESNAFSPQESMSLLEAEAFARRILERTGRLPILYTSAEYLNRLAPPGTISQLSRCALWVASYTNTPVVPALWITWALWQFTNGQSGPQPHQTPGIGKANRSAFNGDLASLKSWWAV